MKSTKSPFRVLWCLFIMAGLSLPGMAAGNTTDEWPGWRGLHQNGAAQARGIFQEGTGLKVVWKQELGSGYSSISISRGSAVTMFSDHKDDYMVSLETHTGKEQWRYKIHETYKGHTGSHDGTLSTPLIHGDMVYGLSGKGAFFALDFKTGRQVWRHDLVKEYQAKAPTYGFTTSPVASGKVVALQIGGPENHKVAGFDAKSGKRLWTQGTDTIEYQSPILAEIHGQAQLLCPGKTKLVALNPQTGAQLWEFSYEKGGQSITPVPAGENRLFLAHSHIQSSMLSIHKEQETFRVETVWTGKDIKNTASVTIYHQGYLYGYNGNTLTCLDAATGERAWRSRPPGSGGLALVDGHLLVLTLRGKIHVTEATHEGFREVAVLELFKDQSWTPPSFAEGRIFVRDLHEIAALEVTETAPVAVKTDEGPKGLAPGTRFAAFLEKVAASNDKKSMIDNFLKEQKSFPIIEENMWVHAVYRGEQEDLAIGADLYGYREEFPFNRVEGTDFYYFSFILEPDAHIGYHFTRNYDERIFDPRNPNQYTGPFGEKSSMIAMPRFVDSDHLKEPTGKRGKLDEFIHESKIMGNKRKVQVWLPPDYDQQNSNYPVLFVNHGGWAVNHGKIPLSLDNMVGKAMAPAIVVFVHIGIKNSWEEVTFKQSKDNYAKMVSTELVEAVDARYRTKQGPEHRALMATGWGSYSVFVTAFNHPGVFGTFVAQSLYLDEGQAEDVNAQIKDASDPSITFYIDWGKYDFKDTPDDPGFMRFSPEIFKALQDKGFRVLGGPLNTGYDWSNWRTRNDTILALLFPKKES